LYNWADKGFIEILRLLGGKRMYNVAKFILEHSNVEKKEQINICYYRVSSYGQKPDLVKQIEYIN